MGSSQILALEERKVGRLIFSLIFNILRKDFKGELSFLGEENPVLDQAEGRDQVKFS